MMAQNLWKTYYESLDDKQKITIAIGKEILKDSFEIEKTIGFKQWRAAQAQVKEHAQAKEQAK